MHRLHKIHSYTGLVPVEVAQIIFLTAVVTLTLIGAVLDWRTKMLPNWLTVPGFAAALLYHAVYGFWQGGGWGCAASLGFALGGFATGFGILLVLWLIGGGGAGDVKMMGAVGAWLGAELTLKVFLVSVLFVIFGSLAFLAGQMLAKGLSHTRRRYLAPAETTPGDDAASQRLAQLQRQRRRLMPYGVPLAFATWIVLALWMPV
jgi:prepilin peptidase CpaA